MEFKEYSEIENSYNKKQLNIAVEQGLTRGLFNCTEKVHGSSMVFMADHDGVQCGKRTAPLTMEDKFFNFQQVFKEHANAVQALFNDVVGRDTNIKQVSVYGELYGGHYPHPDVPSVDNQTIVQRGLWYSPTNRFYGFDIRTMDYDGKFVWLPYVKCVSLFKEHSIPYAEPLFIGTLDECLAYDNCFQTKIPEKLGLPPIENNLCEGVVIKPWEESLHYGNGARVIFKNKNDHYVEKVQKGGKLRIPQPKHVPTEEENKALELFSMFVNDNRLKAVLSKHGEVAQDQFQVINKALIDDVRKDFVKEYDLKDYGQWFGKYVPRMTAELIRENFVDIINGEF